MNRQSYEERFTEQAIGLKFLSADAAGRLRSDSGNESAPLGTLAMRRGLMTAEQIDIVECMLVPTEIAPGYKLLEMIGRGGMGVVYRAMQIDLQRTVAIKTIQLNGISDPHIVKRFEREALMIGRLQHPNIVQALNFGQHNGRYYLAMEFVDGRTCQDLIANGQRLSPVTAWSFVRQTAVGLMHASRNGVIHRDIKPANLLVTRPTDGASLPAGVEMVKIADFGLAMMSLMSEYQARLTTANAIIGSPAFMSPEQIAGGPIDFRSDMYSLGVTALMLLSSQTPFGGKSFAQLAASKKEDINENDSMLTGLKRDEANLIRKMTASNYLHRPSSYQHLVDMIDGLDLSKDSQPHYVHAKTHLIDLHTWPFQANSNTETQTIVIESTAKASHSIGRRKLWSLILCVLPLIALIGYLTLADKSPSPRKFTKINAITPLFDGKTLAGWDVGGRMFGAWNVDHAPDDSNAIACYSDKGSIGHRLPDWEYQRISLLIFNVADGVTTDIDFGFATKEVNSPCNTLRVTSKKLAIGTKLDRFGSIRRLREMPTPSSMKSRYHVVDIERQLRVWYIFFEQEFVGSIPIAEPSDVNHLRIVVTNNHADSPSVYFADMQVAELHAADSETD